MPRACARGLVLASLAMIAASAAAEPVRDDAARRTTAEPSADEVRGAPVPGTESGRLDRGLPPEPATRRIVRGLLFVPWVVYSAVTAPVRAAVWCYDYYQLRERFLDLFFNDARTFGIYPVAELLSGYGFSVGGRLVHNDLFGARERLLVQALTGGRYRHLASAELRSGSRLGPGRVLQLEVELERRPKDAFYGIGNAGPGVEAHFRQELVRARSILDLRLARSVSARPAVAISEVEISPAETDPIDALYPRQVMAHDTTRFAYGELELRWDTRGPGSPWELPAVPATGWLVSGFAGRVQALDGGESYWQYGADLQRFFRLGPGPRVLAARLYGEAITGDVVDVPITMLPRLGGSTFLRGYPSDRFRDRVAAVGSLEYRWDLSIELAATAFVDAGRVYGGLDDVTLDGLRVGFGVGLEVYSATSFLLRASVASSRDGGVFVNMSLDPGRDLAPRVERR